MLRGENVWGSGNLDLVSLVLVQTKNELKISKFISFHCALRPTDTVERSILTWHDWQIDHGSLKGRRRHCQVPAKATTVPHHPLDGYVLFSWCGINLTWPRTECEDSFLLVILLVSSTTFVLASHLLLGMSAHYTLIHLTL